jgi:hypothetical protein
VPHRAALSSRYTSFVNIPLVGGAFLVSHPAALAGDLPLLLWRHCRKPPARFDGLSDFRFFVSLTHAILLDCTFSAKSLQQNQKNKKSLTQQL